MSIPLNTKKENIIIEKMPCGCGTNGLLHTGNCCGDNDGILAKTAAGYLETRRTFLRHALIGGMMAGLLPLLATEAEADLFKPSADDQKRLGDQAAAEYLKKFKEVKDSRARSFNRVGMRLVNALNPKERGPWAFRFRVLESKDINAFALPGGNMFIYTGLLARIGSADELAAVTAHEVAHVREEHWARRVAEQTKREAGIGILLGLTRAGRAWQQVAGLGNGLLSLKYSRGDEDSADAKGLDNMVRAGFDPAGMIDLFNTLQKASGSKEGGPDILRTHPLTKDRIRRTQDRIDRLYTKPENRTTRPDDQDTSDNNPPSFSREY